MRKVENYYLARNQFDFAVTRERIKFIKNIDCKRQSTFHLLIKFQLLLLLLSLTLLVQWRSNRSHESIYFLYFSIENTNYLLNIICSHLGNLWLCNQVTGKTTMSVFQQILSSEAIEQQYDAPMLHVIKDATTVHSKAHEI